MNLRARRRAVTERWSLGRRAFVPAVTLPTRGRAQGGAPPLRRRLVVVALIATTASLVTLSEAYRPPDHPGDFGLVWFGAKALLHGANPYPLVGPDLIYNWPWQVLLYPATAMIAAIPFSFLPQLAATVLFVWLSTALLAYAITADGWYRLPIFLSSTFLIAASAAQWSPLVTAALCIPSLAWVVAVKPNLGLALLASATSLRPIKVAFVGGVILTTISLIVYPAWPVQWLQAIQSVTIMHVPMLLPGGPFVLLALLRWRRPEARLIVALACVPQTNSWYEGLPLFLVPATFRQSLMLSVVSTSGILFQEQFMVARSEKEINYFTGILMIAFVYLPATLLVLHRPNEAARPPFLDRLVKRDRPRPTTDGAVDSPAARLSQ